MAGRLLTQPGLRPEPNCTECENPKSESKSESETRSRIWSAGLQAGIFVIEESFTTVDDAGLETGTPNGSSFHGKTRRNLDAGLETGAPADFGIGLRLGSPTSSLSTESKTGQGQGHGQNKERRRESTR